MVKYFDNSELKFITMIIEKTLTDNDCKNVFLPNVFNCNEYKHLEEYYHLAHKGQNSEFAELINFDGYDFEKEFLVNLYE